MNKLNQRTRTKIEPSTRDSISTWLDVLTAMLVMPDTQRLQVRDELEDHLRSRVDDLLIMGKSEPEAIRIAVAELGETAELAKLITHAHTKSNPRRNIMNAALITVALAGMSFGGFTFINATGAPSATPNNAGAVPAVVIEETREDEENVHQFDIEPASLIEVMGPIAQAFDQDFSISPDAIRSAANSHVPMTTGVKFVGEFTLEQAIAEVKRVFAPQLTGYGIVSESGGIRIVTTDEYQRSIVETRVYPNPSWITQAHEQTSYADSLRELLGVKFDLGYASIEIIGDSIVVAATPNIHTEFVQLTKELDEVIGKRDASMKTKREQAKEEIDRRRVEFKRRQEQETRESNAVRKLAVGHIQAEFDRVRTELIQKKTLMKELQSSLDGMRTGSNPDQQRLSSKVHSKEMAELEKALVDTQLLYEEYQSRYDYLRDTLIESEYTALFKGLE